jgi:hypothetical protein
MFSKYCNAKEMFLLVMESMDEITEPVYVAKLLLLLSNGKSVAYILV